MSRACAQRAAARRGSACAAAERRCKSGPAHRLQTLGVHAPACAPPLSACKQPGSVQGDGGSPGGAGLQGPGAPPPPQQQGLDLENENFLSGHPRYQQVGERGRLCGCRSPSSASGRPGSRDDERLERAARRRAARTSHTAAATSPPPAAPAAARRASHPLLCCPPAADTLPQPGRVRLRDPGPRRRHRRASSPEVHQAGPGGAAWGSQLAGGARLLAPFAGHSLTARACCWAGACGWGVGGASACRSVCRDGMPSSGQPGRAGAAGASRLVASVPDARRDRPLPASPPPHMPPCSTSPSMWTER